MLYKEPMAAILSKLVMYKEQEYYGRLPVQYTGNTNHDDDEDDTVNDGRNCNPVNISYWKYQKKYIMNTVQMLPRDVVTL